MIRFAFVAMIAMLFVIPLAPSAHAQGDACPDPQFQFGWLDSGNPFVNIQRKAADTVKFCIRPIAGSADATAAFPAGCQAADLSTWHVVSVPGEQANDGQGVDVAVDLRHFHLVADGGQVVVHYASQSCGGAKVSPPQTALQRHSLTLDAGQVYSYGADGKFESAPELVFVEESNLTRSLTGFLDIRFSQIGAIDEETTGDETSDDGMTDDGMMDDGVMEMDETPKPFNPLVDGGSVVRADFGIGFYPYNARPENVTDANGTTTREPRQISRTFGLLFGAGFSTVPNDGDDVDARMRVFAGLQFRVLRFNTRNSENQFHNAIGTGRLLYAYDDFWAWEELQDTDGDPSTPDTLVKREEKERLVFDWRLIIPAFRALDNADLALRLYADIPASGDGPSDLRVSALFTFKLSNILGN